MTPGLAGPRGALEREVVGLGAARGDDDLARLRTEPVRQSLMGVIERGTGRATERVRRTGVPERLGQERQHRVEDLATQGRRRRMVQVDRHRADRTPPGGCRPPGREARTRRSSFVHGRTRRPSVAPTASPDQHGGIASHRSQTVVIPLVQLVLVAVPIVLVVLVVDTLRAASQMGGLPPFTSTYRAYSA